MDCSMKGVQARKVEREINENGVEFDAGSVYERLSKLTDVRKAKGKLYRLETVLVIIVLAKLSGEDRPYGIADWAKNHREQVVELLHLERPNMPSHHTIHRIMGKVVYEEEIERLVGEYNQGGDHGDVYAMDGKAVRGMRKKDEEGSEYLLSVYDVQQGKVLSQSGRGTQGKRDHEGTPSPKNGENLSKSGHRRCDSHAKDPFSSSDRRRRRLRVSRQGKSTPSVPEHSATLCTGISQAGFRKNPNRFPNHPKSQ